MSEVGGLTQGRCKEAVQGMRSGFAALGDDTRGRAESRNTIRHQVQAQKSESAVLLRARGKPAYTQGCMGKGETGPQVQFDEAIRRDGE